MAVKLHRAGFEQAKELIGESRVVIDDRDAWSEHRPSAATENEYIEEHGIQEFGKWFLGVDDETPRENKGHYKFPYGDFENVHRCAILSAESRAGQYDYQDIELAVAHLHGMLEAARGAPSRSR